MQIYDAAERMLRDLQNELSYLSQEEEAEKALNKIRLLIVVNKKFDYNSIPELNELMKKVREGHGRLLEKKRAEIMMNGKCFERFDELEKECRLVLSEEYSQTINGVKLFEEIMNLSSDIKLRYNHNKIALIFPKRKNWLLLVNKAMAIVENAGEKTE